jgi:hypothetical protein
MEFKIELDKELKKEKDKSKEEFGNFTKETQLLLDAGADEEKNALRVANLNYDLRNAEKSRGTEIDRKKLEEDYNLEVYTKEEIKSLCVKYDLRFLQTNRYKGKLDGDVATKLSEFIKNNPEGVGDSSDAFYVIASEETFYLYGRDATSRKSVNPILVYKVPKEDMYVFIHRWGEGYTILRRLRGLYMETAQNMISVGTSIFTVVISIIFALLFDKFTGEWYQYLNIIWIVGVSLGLNYTFLSILFKDDKNFDRRESDYIWDKTDARRKK